MYFTVWTFRRFVVRWGLSYRDSGSCYSRLKNTRSWLLGWIMLERRLLFTNCTWERLLLPILPWEAMLKSLCTRTSDSRCSQSVKLSVYSYFAFLAFYFSFMGILRVMVCTVLHRDPWMLQPIGVELSLEIVSLWDLVDAKDWPRKDTAICVLSVNLDTLRVKSKTSSWIKQHIPFLSSRRG